jgi:hypothetical protein
MSAGRRARFSVRERVSAWLDDLLAAPSAICPRCQGADVEHYDPLIFAPVRALSGRRRLRCRACGFVWRRSREGKRPGMLGWTGD